MPVQGLNLPGIYGAAQDFRLGEQRNRLLDAQMQQLDQQNQTTQRFNQLLGGVDFGAGLGGNADQLGKLYAIDPQMAAQIQQGLAGMDAAQAAQLQRENETIIRALVPVLDGSRPFDQAVASLAEQGIDTTGLTPENVEATIYEHADLDTLMSGLERTSSRVMSGADLGMTGEQAGQSFEVQIRPDGSYADIQSLGSGGTKVEILNEAPPAVPRPDLATEEFGKQSGEDAAGRLNNILAVSQNGNQGLFNLGRMVDIISQPDFETGPGTPALVATQAFADALGANINEVSQGLFGKDADQLSSAQEFQRLSRQLTLQLTSQLKGALSNKELSFLEGATANLGQSTDANIKALSALLAAQEFAVNNALEASRLPAGDLNAFQQFESNMLAGGDEQMRERAAEIEAEIRASREASETIETADPDALADALLRAMGGQ